MVGRYWGVLGTQVGRSVGCWVDMWVGRLDICELVGR